MEGKNVGVEMAAEAARETAALVAENPEQKNEDAIKKRARELDKKFGEAVERLIGDKLATTYTIEGKWVVLDVYLTGSDRRQLHRRPENVVRGILAHYLNTPFKVKSYPIALGEHHLTVVALLQR